MLPKREFVKKAMVRGRVGVDFAAREDKWIRKRRQEPGRRGRVLNCAWVYTRVLIAVVTPVHPRHGSR